VSTVAHVSHNSSFDFDEAADLNSAAPDLDNTVASRFGSHQRRKSIMLPNFTEVKTKYTKLREDVLPSLRAVVCIWNLVQVPLQVAFEYDVETLIALEGCTFVVYAAWLVEFWTRSEKSGMAREITELLYRLTVMLPLPTLALFTGPDRSVSTILCLIRLTELRPLVYIFAHATNRKLPYVHLIRIVKTVLYYLLLSHFIACMWIEMAKVEDNSHNSWLRKVPVPQSPARDDTSITLSQDTVYIHAIYWSIVTFSHIGIGDITAVTPDERIFNCFVILVYTFAYAILFGNMASLV
jgi:hypothetical protein